MAKGKYRDWLTADGLARVEQWARAGLTNEQIADKIGIGCNTLSVWRKQFESFAKALDSGKECADIQVENALFKKANGYTVKIRKAYKLKDVVYENGKKVSESERLEFADEETYVPGDIKAQIFWLTNRKSDVWREKTSVLSAAEECETVIISGEDKIED